MEPMIRKQIYIRRRQETLLKRAAKKRGLSEAEIIRQALDRELSAGAVSVPYSNTDALEKASRFIAARRALTSGGASPYRWRREDAYEERWSRYDRTLHATEKPK